MSSRPVLAVLACLSLFIAGCSDGITGTYAIEAPKEQGGGSMTLELKSGGKAVFAVAAGGQSEKKEGTYTVSGDKITVTVDGSPQVFTKQKDGSLLSDGMGLTFKKK